ncbi:DUF2203 domain-containing protein [Oscillatoriales cyanobacterium LEGE 11467]|uniref:DUF2203 domain-containing protein n=1 Tax=Zarconia navalis LEGE 11467 TaxID=1828826 RepID=A0A928Z8G4_9CYAN|nr:DUF2203 domain-containing protein [Zarconia navalis]MBE9040509.1 DUF2203 domain-containing protein [Zarconia navalis LEGE 11467]
MTSPPDPNRSPASNDTEDSDFESMLANVEKSLQALKQRHHQIQHDTERHAELTGQHEQLKKQLRRSKNPQLQAQLQTQLQKISQQLEELEIRLESTLMSWETLREPFWQAVRYGGLGIIIGWVLKSCSS